MAPGAAGVGEPGVAQLLGAGDAVQLHQPGVQHCRGFLGGATGIEPETNSLEGSDSTTELLPPSHSPPPVSYTHLRAHET